MPKHSYNYNKLRIAKEKLNELDLSNLSFLSSEEKAKWIVEWRVAKGIIAELLLIEIEAPDPKEEAPPPPPPPKQKKQKKQKKQEERRGRPGFLVIVNGNQTMNLSAFARHINMPRLNVYLFFVKHRRAGKKQEDILNELLKQQKCYDNVRILREFPPIKKNAHQQNININKVISEAKALMDKVETKHDLRSLYYKLMKSHHPDVGGNETVAKAIISHYEYLLENYF